MIANTHDINAIAVPTPTELMQLRDCLTVCKVAARSMKQEGFIAHFDDAFVLDIQNSSMMAGFEALVMARTDLRSI